MSFADDGSRTSPAWSKFDPGEISDAAPANGTWKVSSSAPAGVFTLSSIRAPSAGGTLIFRQASRWVANPPGGDQDPDGWMTKVFTSGESLVGVQITEVKKDGSTAGEWEIFL